MNFSRKVKNKIKSFYLFWLVKLSLLVNSPYLTAWCLSAAQQRINKKGEYKVLCLGRTIFLDDVFALSIFGKKLAYTSIHLTHWQVIFDHFVRGVDKDKITENNYFTNNYCQEGRHNYYLYLGKLIPVLKKILNFDVVLSGSIGYVVQQEIEKVCQENKIPFAVLHKEGMSAYGDYADVSGYQGCRFRGDRILFYNEAVARAITEFKIPGLTKEKARVVGIPRFDFYFGEKNKTEGKQLVLFSFHPLDRFFLLIGDLEKTEKARERAEQFHKLTMEYALANPGIKVIIKTKSAKYYLDYVKDIQNKYFKEPINNLTITNEGVPFKLIRDSFAVFGFNSTVLIEAVVAGKIIISPYMKDLIIDQSWDFFKDYPSIINYVESVDDLDKAIKNFKTGNIGDEIKDKFLEKLIYKPDGQSSARAETEIIKLIEDYAK